MPILKIVNKPYSKKEDQCNAIKYIQKKYKTVSGLIEIQNLCSFNSEFIYQQMNFHRVIYNQNTGKQLNHWIISFEASEIYRLEREGIDQYTIFECIGTAIDLVLTDYQVIYAAHENTKYFHIHILFNNTSIYGEKYKGKNKDYIEFLTWLQYQFSKETNSLYFDIAYGCSSEK